MLTPDALQERADAFADLTIRFVQALPESPIARPIGSQLLRAATSVAANYRAARHGRSHAEFTAKIGLVSEETDEALFWLERLRRARITCNEPLDPLLVEAGELAKIFGASARTARAKHRRR